MKVVLDSMIEITDPNEKIINYCKKNLILANPEYAKKQRMGFWVGNTPKTLTLFEQIKNKILIPYGCLDDISMLVPHDVPFSCSRKVKDTSIEYGNIELYDYQQKALKEILKNISGILKGPAGSGKTIIGLQMIAKSGMNALWITHTRDLLNQAKKEASTYFDKKKIGTIVEGKINIKELTFATIQSLANMDLPRYKNQWDIIIVDECHRVSASADSVTMYAKVLNNLCAYYKYGLSATLHRADGLIRTTYALLGNVACEIPKEATKEKIMPVGIKPIKTDVRLDDSCYNNDGTLNYNNMINYLCENEDRNHIIIQQILEHQDSPILVLSHRVGHLERLLELLPEKLFEKAAYINGSMTSKKQKALREHYIEQMRKGEKQILFATYNLAKEGLDIPRLEVLIMATPYKDYAIITQAIGRVARVFKGKTKAMAVDLVDNDYYLQKSYKKRLTTYRKNDCYEMDNN